MPFTNELVEAVPNALIYGKSGVGKTYSLDTLPKPLFVYNFDLGGMLSLRGCEGIEYEEFSKLTEFDQDLLKRDFSVYESIALDSLTTLADKKMDTLRASATSKVPTQQDYLLQMNYIMNITKYFLDIPTITVITAHEELMKDELTGQIMGVPLITGKLKFKLPLFFSEVYHARITRKGGEEKYVFMTKADSLYQAKSRLAARAPIEQFEPQDFNHIWNKEE